MMTHVGLLLVTSVVFSQADEKQEQFNYDFQQNDYHLVHDRVEVARYNRKYVKQFDVKNFKFNRTTKAVNLTFAFNVDLGYSLEIVVQAYKFMSNEYRYFPMRLGVHYCKAIASNIIGVSNFIKCGNFTGCPLVKGRVYHICNWVPEERKLPPFVPSGSYMLEIQGLYFDEEIFVERGYASITRPEV